MAEQANTTKKQTGERKQRNEFVQTRKSLPYTLKVQSDTMLRYMTRNGGAAAGAFQRVAGLIQFTANDAEVRERLDLWFEGVMGVASERASALSSQQEKYTEGMVVNVTRPKVPDNYQYTVEITHPIFWQFIGLVEMIDNVMAEIEFLWLAGQLEDVHLQNASGQAVNTIKDMVNRIYYVTNASRTRKGGLYSPQAYKELMQALTKGDPVPEQQETEDSPEEAAVVTE
ncbi:hypothetical protein [Shewanella sp. GD03713]|uniref:hypothetical protein n=1 Tax=Shewanella TaxID=22 RepID=UPI0024473163|nr:hypothetical protein [Shewanella sp. GD03713]MDH1472665.1 hypothetical protein [Shewanella sp. GD03713]